MTIITTDTPATIITSAVNETIIIVPDVTVGHASLVQQAVYPHKPRSVIPASASPMAPAVSSSITKTD